MNELKRFYPYLHGDGVPVADPLFHSGESGSNPTSPLQLHFHEIPIETACLLNAYWHSMLPKITPFNARAGRYSIAYVAEHEGNYYASAIWSGAVARLLMADDVLELRRMAISSQSPSNTASRMLGWMVRDIAKRFPVVKRLVSYQDTEVHTGTIYKASGWHPAFTNDGHGWAGMPNRRRQESQTISPKIRWEKVIR